jgi:CRISPR-associated protein Cas5d
MGIKLEVWGDFASFNRPEMKVERVTYDVMTPSAARGVLEAIYWKPQMRWVIDEIRVLRPVRFTNVRRNEINTKVAVKGASGVERAAKGKSAILGLPVDDPSVRAQRAAIVLRDVHYGIAAHVEVLDPTDENGVVLKDPAAKHQEMFRRRAGQGQYFHHPYLGCREFPADFALVEEFPVCPDELRGPRPLGLMLRDIEFVPDPKGTVIESHRGTRCVARPRFFRALMVDGVIEIPPLVAGGAPS